MDEINAKVINSMKKLAKIALKIAKILVKFLFKLLMSLGPVALVIIAAALFFYFVVIEYNGPEKKYSDRENELSELLNPMKAPSYIIKKLRPENDVVYDFFKYYSLQSLWQVDINDKENKKLVNVIDKKAVKDYYEREGQFVLDPNFLFNLNKYMYKDKAYYPEAFIKPVYYDKEKFEVKDLRNEHGRILAKSKKVDLKNGRPLEKEEFSVHDYGLASILKYREMKFESHLKGVYNKEDFYNEETGRVETRVINEEYDIPIPPEDKEKKYIIEKALTFAGNIEFLYEEGEDLRERVRMGESENEKDNVSKILKERFFVQELDKKRSLEEGRDVYKQKEIKLYKYRDEENSGVYNKVEHPNGVKKDEREDKEKYYYDYLESFSQYLPDNVLDDLVKRIDYEVLMKEEDEKNYKDEKGNIIGGITNIGGLRFREGEFIGSHKDSQRAQNTVQYDSFAQRYGEEFGVDPYIITAIIANESGGNKYAPNGGLGQIIGTGERKIAATNANGERVVVSVKDRSDPNTVIRFMTAYIKNGLERYNGDYFLAIMAYNMGNGVPDWIVKNFPEKVRSGDWLDLREDARIHYAKKDGYEVSRSGNQWCLKPEQVMSETSGIMMWGNSCYFEAMLRFYRGNGEYIQTKLEENNKTHMSDPLDTRHSEEGERTRIGTGNIEDNELYPKEKDEDGKEKKEKTVFDKLSDKFKAVLKSVAAKIGKLVIKYQNTVNKLIRKYEKTSYHYYEYNASPTIATDIRRFTESFNKSVDFSDTTLKGTDSEGDNIATIGFIDDYTGAAPGRDYSDMEFDLSKYAGAGGYIPPLEKYVITSPFGGRYDPISSKWSGHLGIDLAAAQGTPIYASRDGVVIDSKYAGSYGNMVLIEHDSSEKTRYAHMVKRLVSAGDEVKQGQVIGLVGSTGRSTGPHCHFEWIINGKVVNPKPIVDGLLMGDGKTKEKEGN